MPDNEVDLTREVLIAAPYNKDVTSTVLLESLPVWFDLGWQKVEGQDYGLYSELVPAEAESSLSVDASAPAPKVTTKKDSINPPPGA